MEPKVHYLVDKDPTTGTYLLEICFKRSDLS
jgi:hypothetical protein